MAENKEKVVLAYSGGLDTSVIIPWIIETPCNISNVNKIEINIS